VEWGVYSEAHMTEVNGIQLIQNEIMMAMMLRVPSELGIP